MLQVSWRLVKSNTIKPKWNGMKLPKHTKANSKQSTLMRRHASGQGWNVLMKVDEGGRNGHIQRLPTHKHIYPVSLWTERTSQTFPSSSEWGQPAWPLGVINMQFTKPDSRGSSESIHKQNKKERNVWQAAKQTTDSATVSREKLPFNTVDITEMLWCCNLHAYYQQFNKKYLK